MRTFNFRRVKVLAVWAVISVLMQVGFLYFLEKQINGGPADAYTYTPQLPTPKVVEKVVNLQAAQVSDLKASYAKDYLAYTDNTGLQVVNVKTGKVVFSENKPQTGDILGYHWLPDRNALLLVIKEPVASNTKSEKTATTTASQKFQTNLYPIEFPSPDENVKPDKGEPKKIQGFPSDGKIETIDLSTYTNSIYMLVNTSRDQIVYEIDVMNNTWRVQKPGEKVSNMVTSDLKGTLYIQSTLTDIHQIVAIKHPSKYKVLRDQVFKGSQYVLLGVQDNKVLVGNVENGNLTKILSVPDTAPNDKTSKKTSVEWQGSIAWKNYKTITGPGNYWVLYNQDQAVALQDGKVKEVKFSADKDYLTLDGRELMQVVPNPDGTVKVTIKPL